MNVKSGFTKTLLGIFILITWIDGQTAVAGGSSYSRFGIGDLMYYGSSRSAAMGGTGIALLHDGFINRLNPAGLAALSRTRISAGFEYSNFSSSDDASSGNYRRGAFNGVAFGIPVDKKYGIGMLLESSPFSSVHYAVETTDEKLKQTFYGTGGLSLLGVGASYAPFSSVTLGAKFNYIFGRIRQVDKFDFFDSGFADGEMDRSDFYSGMNATLGAIYRGSTDSPLSLGLVLSTPTTFAVERERILTSNQSQDTTGRSTGTVDLPLAVGVGFSYLFSNRYYLTADLYHQSWEQSNFFGTVPVEIRNATRVGVGFESLPERETEAYFKRVAYRAGIYYNSTYYKINDTPINEYFVTFGLGLPVGPDARINIGLHAGIRGETTNNLQRDTILRLTFSLSASEAWFLTFEEE
ncbi:MAG: hypothetical protein HYZ01_08210 [Ignavibacteriales bacterium]|nr:hypothetical protein [Ignavibacteriales bacterium]